jgi:3-deoxy-D-arabino-heptulosonate 7-phosphate (DAHP) synthase
MANDEMKTVLELDVSFLREFSDKVWFNYAEMDDWVSGQREVVLRALRGTPAEAHVVHGRSDIPHGFCITHNSEVASQCVKWMNAGGFLGVGAPVEEA